MALQRLLVLALLIGTSFGAACGGGTVSNTNAANGKQVRIAYFGPAGNAGVDGQMVGARAQVATDGNATLTLVDTKFDPATEISVFQDAQVSQRYDAYIIIPLDAASLLPVVKKAVDAGKTVIIVNLPLSPENNNSAALAFPNLAGTVLFPYTLIGQYQAQMMIQMCGTQAKCNVGYIPGVLALTVDQTVLASIKSTLQSHPNIKLIQGQEGKYDIDTSRKSATDLLQAHPEITVMTADGDQMADGIERAVKNQNLTGKVQIAGNGASDYGVTAVRAGRWYGTTLWLPQTEAAVSVDIAIKTVRGQTVDKRGRIVEQESTYPPVLTRDNLAMWSDFTAQWSG